MEITLSPRYKSQASAVLAFSCGIAAAGPTAMAALTAASFGTCVA